MSKRRIARNYLSLLGRHIIGWSIFISYEMAYLFVVGASLSRPQNYLLNYLLNILLFYFNAHVLLHYASLKFRNSVVVPLLLILLEIAVFVMLKYPINLALLNDYPLILTSQEYQVHLITNALRTFYIIGFSTAYWFALTALRRSNKISTLETNRLLHQNEKILMQKDLLKSRNAYLQAQVNPHLIFNTLNYLYNTSAKVSGKLAEAIMTLSEIMRYALNSPGPDQKVPLEDEINHIHNFILLNQLRHDEKLQVVFEVTGEPSGLRIIPLSLITLIENIFSYGDLLNADQPAQIDLRVENNRLHLELFNIKQLNRRSRGHGTGIQNLRERLEHYYPDDYSLDIRDLTNTFSLTLILNLNRE